MKNYFLIICSVIILISSSCIKESFNQEEVSRNINNESSIAMPIGYKTTSILDIFAENVSSGQLVEDDQGLLWFRFNEEFLHLIADDLVTFPEFNASYTITNNTGANIDLNTAGSNTVINQTFYLDFGYSQGTNSEEIDSILLNNMDLDITVLLALPANSEINVTFPGIKYNDLIYSKDLILSSTNNFADFMQYTIHLDNQTATKNRLEINFELTLNSSPIIITPGQTIVNVDLHFSNINYQIVYGYIGQHTINSSVEDIMVNLDNNRLNGYFDFDHSSFNINSENSFGVPFRFTLNDYTNRAYNAQNQIIDENIMASGESDVIAFPNLNQVGETIFDTTSIESDPIRLYFQDYYSVITGSLSAQGNPNGNSDYNFVTKESQLSLSAELAVPFWGYTDNLSMHDTIDFNLRSFFASNFDQISRMLFILNFTNANPINSRSQVYFYDSGGTMLDSMFSDPPTIYGASEKNSIGKVSSNVNPPVKVEFLEDRINKIANTSYIIIKTNYQTIDVTNSPPVSWKMFSDYYFYYHIGIAVDVEGVY